MLSEFYPNALKAVRDAEAALGVRSGLEKHVEPSNLTSYTPRSAATTRATPASAFSVRPCSVYQSERLTNSTAAVMDKAWGSGDPTTDIDTTDHVIFDDHGCTSRLGAVRRAAGC